MRFITPPVLHRLAVMRSLYWATAAAVVVTGCSSPEPVSPPPPVPTTNSPTTERPTSAAPPGVSPGGVTTAVDVPADAEESQYGQACRAAKLWMDAQPGDRLLLIEPYLAQLQAPGAVGPGTFGTTWASLTQAQQAGAVMAVEAAANGECG